MKGITWGSGLDCVNEYIKQTEKAKAPIQTERGHASQLSTLEHTANKVQNVFETDLYRLKVEKIQGQINANAYEIDMTQLLSQLLAEDVLMGPL